MDKGYIMSVRIWPSKHRRKLTFCLWYTLWTKESYRKGRRLTFCETMHWAESFWYLLRVILKLAHWLKCHFMVMFVLKGESSQYTFINILLRFQKDNYLVATLPDLVSTLDSTDTYRTNQWGWKSIFTIMTSDGVTSLLVRPATQPYHEHFVTFRYIYKCLRRFCTS